MILKIFNRFRENQGMIFTLAISKCYGKVRLLFSARQISRFTRLDKSHSSCAHGLVVMFAFQPRDFVFEPVRMR